MTTTVAPQAEATTTEALRHAVSLAEAMSLPAKLQWALVGWYRTTGAYREAEELLDRIEMRGETQRSLEERARLAFAAGRQEEAVALLRERVHRSPSATAQVALAKLYLEIGRLDDAAAISLELSQTHPDLVTVATLAADVARASGDVAAARAHCERILDQRPDNTTAYLALARLAMDEAELRVAAALVEHVLAVARDAVTPAQLSLCADILGAAGEVERAQGLRERAARLNADRTAALFAEIRNALGAAEVEESRSQEVEKRAPPPSKDGRGTALADTCSPAPLLGEGLGEGAETHDGSFTPTPEPPEVDPRAIVMLREDFGHQALRPGQAAVIANVLAQRDTLATMPTGAGKSLTFQLPAMLLDGVTLVISPLIALMKDQVESLPPAVRARSIVINSTLAPDELRRALKDLGDGTYKLVYAAPERLRQYAFLRALCQAGVSLVVIDEAHCISLWGHDFRPDYLSIPKALPELGNPILLAITATATPAMAKAIAAGLGRDLDRVRVSLFRPNLFYEAHRLPNREQKVAKVVEVCRQERGSGIVYVGSRKDAEAIAGVLRDRGVGAIPYHAGLDPETRARNQERFMRGAARVVVATVAFGMGVDKADVRFIVHLSPPKSLEAYAQESGRAGRDGKPARCVLLVAPSDQANLNRIARRDELDIDTLRRVYAGIKRAASGRWVIVDPATLLVPPSLDDDADNEADPRVALGVLEQAGLILRHPDAPVSRSLWFQTGVDTASDGALSEASDPAWTRFVAWAGLDAGVGGTTVRTAAACAALDLTPTELDLLLSRQPGLFTRKGGRAVCLEILPVQDSAAATLHGVLDRARIEARRRIELVMVYAAGRSCRHATLAGHLGEKIPPCGSSCDVCTGAASRRSSESRSADAVTGGAPSQRSHLTAADAMAVLNGVRTLPFPMGKTGLGKLLTGSVESRVRADRSPSFGALSELSRSRVETLIDRLVADGFLHRNLEHEFKLISLTERGISATLEDLSDYATAARPARTKDGGSSVADDDIELDAEGEALLERLYAWRRDRAAADRVPPYVVAHNSTLRALAHARPASTTALGNVSGFGPARVEKYGAEVLALIAGT